ncbi:hypothetical protein [uncultured Helicobacter sp.]|uniref:hypothetical protein n=1 Tax=uncultured Helicobacter sp. TaxID=175537 RepID=UPI0026058677|nr:hypothetical protein [uncultured Helicobacter sp.]
MAFIIDEIHQTYSICGINIIDLTIDTGEIGDSPLLQALNPRIHLVAALVAPCKRATQEERDDSPKESLSWRLDTEG